MLTHSLSCPLPLLCSSSVHSLEACWHSNSPSSPMLKVHTPHTHTHPHTPCTPHTHLTPSTHPTHTSHPTHTLHPTHLTHITHPTHTEFVWSQEEPENMGPWSFIAPRFRRLLGVDVSHHVLIVSHVIIVPLSCLWSAGGRVQPLQWV